MFVGNGSFWFADLHPTRLAPNFVDMVEVTNLLVLLAVLASLSTSVICTLLDNMGCSLLFLAE